MNESTAFSLKQLNTFGIEAYADELITFTSIEELQAALKRCNHQPSLILGGGSNVLFTKNIAGTVLHNRIPGIDFEKKGMSDIRLRVGAGVKWHDLVMYAVEHGLGGIENMSLIPGSVGAAPMQNIGAYGVEIKDVFHALDAFHIPSGEVHRFKKEDCAFGYRESVFKRKYKGQYVICSVELNLSTQPELNTAYGAIETELNRLGLEPSVQSISQAVINIRRSKLPDPKEIGNAGSFFKNPVITQERFEKIKKNFPDIPNYPAEKGRKLAAGWLIEKAGWKGKDLGGYGVHDQQALVLVNRGGAKGADILALSENIIQSIQETFGIDLEREVNII